MQLSKNFTLEEMTASETARRKKISNKPTQDQIKNLEHLAKYILQPLREMLKKPIIVNSGFRSKALNQLVGGDPKSHHLCNEFFAAADIVCKGASLEALMDAVIELNLPVEEAIIEYDKGVLHITSRRPAKEILTRQKIGEKFVYSPYTNPTTKAKKSLVKKAQKKIAKKKTARRSK